MMERQIQGSECELGIWSHQLRGQMEAVAGGGHFEFAIAGLTLLYPQEMVGGVPVPRGKLRKVKTQGLGSWTRTVRTGYPGLTVGAGAPGSRPCSPRRVRTTVASLH